MKKSACGVIRVWKSYGRSVKKTLLTLYPKYPDRIVEDTNLTLSEIKELMKIAEDSFIDESDESELFEHLL